MCWSAQVGDYCPLCCYICLSLIAFIMLHLPSCYVTSIYHWLQEIMIIECDFMIFCTGRPAGSLCSEPADGLQLWLPGLKTWGSEFCRVPQWMCSAQHPCLVTALLWMFHHESRASLALSLERQTPRVQELVAVTHSNYCYTLKSTLLSFMCICISYFSREWS